MNWPRTKRAWQRLKLTLAEYLVSSVIQDTDHNRQHVVANVCLVATMDEIKMCRETYFPKEPT